MGVGEEIVRQNLLLKWPLHIHNLSTIVLKGTNKLRVGTNSNNSHLRNRMRKAPMVFRQNYGGECGQANKASYW